MSEHGGPPSALRRRLRLRSAGAWLQWCWLLGPAGLVALTAAGVVRGGPSHPGMPMAWTPLVSIITGIGVGLFALAAAGAAIRLLAAASMPAVAARPACAADLHRRAGLPLAAGDRLGRWRLDELHPPAASPVPGAGVRRIVRGAGALLGVGLLASAAVATPAVLQSRGGGADLLVTAVGGLVLLGLACRPGLRPWRCPAGPGEEAGAGALAARVVRRGGGRPGRRRLIVLRRVPGHRPVRVLEGDLPGWPESAVVRHRLARVLPAEFAAAVRGDAAGAVPGDRGLPAAPPASAAAVPGRETDQPGDSASSDAITAPRSVRGS